jgi:outer membrane protein OmpA-like peptidoglycan-associated protein
MSRSLLLTALVAMTVISGCGKKEESQEKKGKFFWGKPVKSNKKVELDMPESTTQGASSYLEEKEGYLKEDDKSSLAFAEADFFDAAKEYGQEEEKLVMQDAEEELELGAEAVSEDEFAADTQESMKLSQLEEEIVEREEEADVSTKFEKIEFDLNKKEIRADQQDSLKRNILAARDAVNSGKKVIVHGHACQIGSPTYNLSLSQKRANAVKAELVKNGVPEGSVKTLGFGSESPAVWTDKVEKSEMIRDLAPNRRAEIMYS